MGWFITLAFIAIGIFGVWQINPFPPYKNEAELIARVVGSIVWLAIFIGAAIKSASKDGS